MLIIMYNMVLYAVQYSCGNEGNAEGFIKLLHCCCIRSYLCTQFNFFIYILVLDLCHTNSLHFKSTKYFACGLIPLQSALQDVHGAYIALTRFRLKPYRSSFYFQLFNHDALELRLFTPHFHSYKIHFKEKFQASLIS